MALRKIVETVQSLLQTWQVVHAGWVMVESEPGGCAVPYRTLWNYLAGNGMLVAAVKRNETNANTRLSGPSMQIDIAKSADIPDLSHLLSHLFSQEAEFRPDPAAQARGLAQIIGNPETGAILVARENGYIAGMVNLLYTVSTALGARVVLLEDMVVAPGMRDQGVGSSLLQAAVEHARQNGFRRITLLTDHDNASAQRFYRRHGFAASPMVPFRLNLD